MGIRLSTLFLMAGLLTAGCAASSIRQAADGSAPRQEAPSPPPAFDTEALARALHGAVNHARCQHNRPPLAWSDSLYRLAQYHSRDMARRGFFGHTSPDGEGPAERARRFGFPATKPLGDGRRIGVGENLFRTYRYDGYRDVYRQRGDGPRRHERREYDWKSTEALARETVAAWLDSPPHRRTLLSPNFGRHGLGVAVAAQQVYVTQNLF